MMGKRRRGLANGALVLGAGASLVRAAQAGASGLVAGVSVLVVLGFVVWLGWRLTKTNVVQHQAVASGRPGRRVWSAFAPVGLASALARLGVDPSPIRDNGHSALTLAFNGEDLEIWAGAPEPRMVAAVPWVYTTAVVPGRGVVSNAERAAVTVLTRSGVALTFVPASKHTGSMAPALRGQHEQLLTALAQARGTDDGQVV